jgi:GSH-dependent disulfide-bond oxidoreductase
MIKFYFNAAPNPMKVALMLEELGIEYEPIPVDTRKGQQHTDAFRQINPNSKVPAIVDGDVTIFDSNAILLYLADKHHRFVPPIDSAQRGPMLSWLMFIATGIGPFSGQSVHFRHVAPEPKEYALNRYDFEAHRHWKLIDDRLAANQYLVGNDYGIVDIACWGWARLIPHVLGDQLAYTKYPHIKRHLDAISARPAAVRAEALKSKFTFKTQMDDEARRAMFPANERLAKRS